jgi:gluconokinase
MNLLCFDVSSGGISAALLNDKLEAGKIVNHPWVLDTDDQGGATLLAERVVEQFKQTVHLLNLAVGDSIEAICVGTFLHSCVLMDEADQALTPVFTWLDRRGERGVDEIRSRLGDRFHQITGCRYHPMFPVFKLATIRATDPNLFSRAKRIVSIKSLLINRLTGLWIEDHGVASASGLFDITQGDWAREVLGILGLNRNQLPGIARRTEIVGRVTSSAARDFGLREGVAVVAGSGDGFLANMGSDCEVPSRIAVTLGTSAVARQMLPRPVVDLSAGTFCYRADEDGYLLGCAGSNGGNVLDWGRQILSGSQAGNTSENLPIFIPLLHGERSPDWDPHLKGSWHGLTSRHTAADLSRSILEGIIFNLSHFVEIVGRTSKEKPTDLVISGNGFLAPMAAPMLATTAGISTWVPRVPGLASMRGAGMCALRALGQPTPALSVDQVSPLPDGHILERYGEYRRLRSAVK